jgi:hypothetical protein
MRKTFQRCVERAYPTSVTRNACLLGVVRGAGRFYSAGLAFGRSI